MDQDKELKEKIQAILEGIVDMLIKISKGKMKRRGKKEIVIDYYRLSKNLVETKRVLVDIGYTVHLNHVKKMRIRKRN